MIFVKDFCVTKIKLFKIKILILIYFVFLFKAIQREESYEEQIRDLSARLKDVSSLTIAGQHTNIISSLIFRFFRRFYKKIYSRVHAKILV